MKKVISMALVMCMLAGCGTPPEKEETTPVQKEQEVVEAPTATEPEMATIIMSGIVYGEQTIEAYIATLDDPTAKVYDETHYTVEVPENERKEIAKAFHAEMLTQLKNLVGDSTKVVVSEDFRRVDVTGELADQMSFVLSAAILADTAQAYNLIAPADRSCEIFLNGKSIG